LNTSPITACFVFAIGPVFFFSGWLLLTNARTLNCSFPFPPQRALLFASLGRDSVSCFVLLVLVGLCSVYVIFLPVSGYVRACFQPPFDPAPFTPPHLQHTPPLSTTFLRLVNPHLLSTPPSSFRTPRFEKIAQVSFFFRSWGCVSGFLLFSLDRSRFFWTPPPSLLDFF